MISLSNRLNVILRNTLFFGLYIVILHNLKQESAAKEVGSLFVDKTNKS